jgi:LPXTG-motif cell wall-anchored protein
MASCRSMMVELPDTGGMSLLLLIAAVLLLGAGVLLYVLVRRRT